MDNKRSLRNAIMNNLEIFAYTMIKRVVISDEIRDIQFWAGHAYFPHYMRSELIQMFKQCQFTYTKSYIRYPFGIREVLHLDIEPMTRKTLQSKLLLWVIIDDLYENN